MIPQPAPSRVAIAMPFADGKMAGTIQPPTAAEPTVTAFASVLGLLAWRPPADDAQQDPEASETAAHGVFAADMLPATPPVPLPAATPAAAAVALEVPAPAAPAHADAASAPVAATPVDPAAVLTAGVAPLLPAPPAATPIVPPSPVAGTGLAGQANAVPPASRQAVPAAPAPGGPAEVEAADAATPQDAADTRTAQALSETPLPTPAPTQGEIRSAPVATDGPAVLHPRTRAERDEATSVSLVLHDQDAAATGEAPLSTPAPAAGPAPLQEGAGAIAASQQAPTPAAEQGGAAAPGITVAGPAPASRPAAEAPLAAPESAPQQPTQSPIEAIRVVAVTRDDSGTVMTVRLDPDDLGPIAITVAGSAETGLAIEIRAVEQAALTSLQRDQDQLLRLLEQQGLAAQSRQISFALDERGASDRQRRGSRPDGLFAPSPVSAAGQRALTTGTLDILA